MRTRCKTRRHDGRVRITTFNKWSSLTTNSRLSLPFAWASRVSSGEECRVYIKLRTQRAQLSGQQLIVYDWLSTFKPAKHRPLWLVRASSCIAVVIRCPGLGLLYDQTAITTVICRIIVCVTACITVQCNDLWWCTELRDVRRHRDTGLPPR